MDEQSLEYGRREMTKLLNSFEFVDCPGLNVARYAFKIPKTHPALIAQGKNSLVFGLPPRKVGGRIEYLVGKGFKYTDAINFPGVPDNELHLVAKNCGLTIDQYGLDTTLYWLKKMKLGVKIPMMKEFHQSFSGKWAHFVVMPDLRDGGRYRIDETDALGFRDTTNGQQLKLQRDASCKTIVERIKEMGLAIFTAGHGSEEEPLPALEHMFLIQCSKANNLGRLVIGDLNHLAIHEKERQYGIKPSYLK